MTIEEEPAYQCGPNGRHDAPDPVDGQPTSCPCGTVRRIPAPTPKEPR